MPKKEVNDETVDEVKSTLQMSELPLPHEECTAHKADGSVPEGVGVHEGSGFMARARALARCLPAPRRGCLFP